MEPIIRWAGSKRQLLPKLRKFWTNSEARYVEPFCGSACLFFELEPKSGVLGDLNPELVLTYRVLSYNADRVCECLRRLPIGEKAYYSIRSQSPKSLSDVEAAARFIYLNRYCFNGIYRTNRQGDFNVPYGPPRSGRSFDFERIREGATLLKNSLVLEGDFERTLDHVERGDFVYLDPPYAIADRRMFAEYHESTFSVNDLARLRTRLHEIDELGATFVISYADSKEARELLSAWKPTRVRARRHIAGFAGHRRFAFELMASNFREEEYAS